MLVGAALRAGAMPGALAAAGRWAPLKDWAAAARMAPAMAHRDPASPVAAGRVLLGVAEPAAPRGRRVTFPLSEALAQASSAARGGQR